MQSFTTEKPQHEVVSLQSGVELVNREYIASLYSHKTDSTNLVFIDAAVEDYQALVEGLLPGHQAFILSADKDGVEQITHLLSEFENIQTLHIVSHGSSGALHLGSTQLDLERISQYQSQLQSWANALSAEAQILFYGCRVAAGDRGLALVRTLNQLTAANIVASTTPTGCSTKGGDWNFDVHTGNIKPSLAFRSEVLESYRSVLEAKAYFLVDTPGGNIRPSSTFGTGSFQLTNNATAGQKITRIVIDASSAIFPDLVFDPFGDAGDTGAKQFTVDSDPGVGPSHEYLNAHEGGGFDALAIDFDNFAPGQTFTFSIDMDPTSTKGTDGPGPNHAASVSGMELTGARITVEFDDGTVLEGQNYRVPGDNTASQVTLQAGLPPAPGIEVLGLSGAPTTVSDANQTIRVTGPAGVTVALLMVEGAFFEDPVIPAFDPDAFEANAAVAAAEITATIGSEGFVDIPVTLTNSATSEYPNQGLNHFMAVIQEPDGTTGLVSPAIVLELASGNTAPATSGIADVTVDEGAANSVIALFDAFADAQDADTGLTYEVVGNTNPTLVDASQPINSADGNLILDYAASGTGSADITIRATDSEGLSVDTTFTVTVIDPNANTAPTTSGITPITVTEGASDTIVNLFDAFDDAQDLDTALTYEVVGNTNPTLVDTSQPISAANGSLILDYAETGTGSANITVRATDTGGESVETTFTVNVNAPSPPGSSIRIEAEDYISGVNGVDYLDTTAGNNGNATQFTDDVDVEVTSDVTGSFSIKSTANTEFLNYQVNVPTAGEYDLVLRVAAGSNKRRMQVTIGGQLYPVEFDSTGGNQVWADVTLPGVSLNDGLQDIKVEFKKGGVRFNYMELVPTGSAPNTAPTTSGIADVTVDEGSANTIIPLFDAFDDAQDPDTALTYEVLANTNAALFAVPPAINPATGQLTLDYAAAGTGAAEITVRATDTAGLFVDETFTVTVLDPTANTPPTTSGIADVTVNEGAANTIIPLFDAFDDAQDSDTALTYEVIANTNAALFETPPTIAPATGELTLDYAATGTGTAEITVRAADTGALFVDESFTVTVADAPPPGSTIRIEAEDYISGVNGVDYLDTTAGNNGNATQFTDDVDVEVTSDVTGVYSIKSTANTEFLNYQVNVPTAGEYDLVLRVAAGSNKRRMQVTIGGQLYPVEFDSTGGNQVWADVTLPGVNLNAGLQDIKVEFKKGGIRFNYMELVPAGPDVAPPTATLKSTAIALPVDSTANGLFSIDYSDNAAVESNTLDSQDIQVKDPNGNVLTTSFVSVSPAEDSELLTATYAIAAPNGGWQFQDSGSYTVDILANQVLDTSGNPLAPQQFNLALTVSDPPRTEYTYGIADIVVVEGANNSIVDLFEAFEDNQDADTVLNHTVTDNSSPGLVATAIGNSDLTLDYAATGTGAADITVEATDTDGDSTETTFTATVVTPQADDGVIRINAGGGSVYDDAGNLFLADTYFAGGQSQSVSSGRAIANTKYDALYQTQRQGGAFSYSIPVANGNYILSAHIVDWEATSPGQRVFDITVEGQSFYNDLDIYDEIKNAFLDGQDTAKILQGPNKDTTIVTSVSDGSLDIDFSADLNSASIAALEVIPLDQPGILIQETSVNNPDTTVSEDGMVDSYTVVLTAAPTGDVTVNLNVDGSQLTTNVPSLTFNSVNWNQAQTVNISAVDDALVEGPHTEVISHTVSAAVGSNYEGITAEDVSVTILDNDATSGGISFTQQLIDTTDRPTSGAFGPDGRLYVASLIGNIYVYTLNDDYTIDSSKTEVIDVINSLSNSNITGVAFNPYDTVPRIYVSHNQFYANGGAAFPATEFSPYSGQVSILEEVNGVWELQPLVTGIGVSNHDHGVNGLDFDNTGDLYITVGSNTNAGVVDTGIGGIDESPFTAAILKAEITKPNFNGNIDYSLISPEDLIQPVPQDFLDSLPPEIFNPPADLPFDPADSQFWGGYVDVVPGVDVSVYASGLRNPYDLVFATNGLLYATENNANANFGNESTGPYTEQPFGGEQPEELNLIVEGAYYGQPNRNRGRTDQRQNIYFDSPVDLPAEGYTAPIGTFQGSTNGIAEYRATTFGGQLRGNLLAQKLKNQLYNIDLSSDGSQVESITNLNNVATVTGGTTDGKVARGLDVLTGPGGAVVGLDFNRDELTVAIPHDPSITDPTAYDIYPWRAPVQGGSEFVIGGVNFDTDPGDTRVFIGANESTAIEILGIDVSETRIRGSIPNLSSQPNQLLDVFIKDASGSVVSFIDDAFLPLVG